MVKPNVIITLGRSGQRVVKDSWGDSNSSLANPPVSKRLLDGSFTSRSDHAVKSSRKRMKKDASASIYGNNMHKNGLEDLRLKLMRKRHSRDVKLEIAERKKRELLEKVSRAIRFTEAPKESLLRNVTSSRGAAEPIQTDHFGSSYAYRTSTEVRVRSPDRVPIPRPSAGIPTHRNVTDELPRVPSLMPVDDSRTGHFVMSDPLESSRPRVTLPSTSRGPVDPGKLIMEHPPTTGWHVEFPVPRQPTSYCGWFVEFTWFGKVCHQFPSSRDRYGCFEANGRAWPMGFGNSNGAKEEYTSCSRGSNEAPGTPRTQQLYATICSLIIL